MTFLGILWEPILGELGWVSVLVLKMVSCVFTGFFSAPGIPRPDVGEGTLSKSHSPGTPRTSILEIGRSAILHCSPHETIQASLSRGFIEVTKLDENMRIIQENIRKPENV